MLAAPLWLETVPKNVPGRTWLTCPFPPVARRTLEEHVYGIALSLAQRYGLSRWEVLMTHLEFLFSDSG